MLLRDIIESDAAILIAGPTASGKSSLALEIASLINGVIVNADALQVYDCWRVLTARPSQADCANTPHELYGHVGKATRYSVGMWLNDLARVRQKNPGRRLIVVGGTGLYFSALTKGLADIPNVPNEVRAQAQTLVDDGRLDILLTELSAKDPDTIARLDVKNPVRVQRAWEVWRATGLGLAAWHDKETTPLLALSETIPILINAPKEELNARIGARFRAMVSNGALDECSAALENWDPTLPSSRAIGARELIGYLNGQSDLEAAIMASEISTRQYAKRQRSWFRSNMSGWNSMSAAQFHQALQG